MYLLLRQLDTGSLLRGNDKRARFKMVAETLPNPENMPDVVGFIWGHKMSEEVPN